MSILDLLDEFIYAPSKEIINTYKKNYSEQKDRKIDYLVDVLGMYHKIIIRSQNDEQIECDKKVRRFIYFLIIDLTYICLSCNVGAFSCKDLAYMECAVISSLRLLHESLLKYDDPLLVLTLSRTTSKIFSCMV